MLSIHDAILYGNYGVCQIVDIRQENFCQKGTLYYVLSPIDDPHSTIYCPVETGAGRMRPLLTPVQADELIRSIPTIAPKRIENAQARRDQYRKILKNGDRRELIMLIKTLYESRTGKAQAGKRMSASDEEALREAERLLHHELAYVLKLDPDQVTGYIAHQLDKDAQA